MAIKRLRVKLRKRLRGIDITSNWKTNEAGQITVQVQVKRWYMPILALKYLHQCRIPRRYWPLFFWRYYGLPGRKSRRKVDTIKNTRKAT
jgi:hypothetical protein